MGGWTTIKVPVELRDRIKQLSEKLGKPYWLVLTEALSFFETQLRNPRVKESLSNIDKAAWYIVKLATSVGAFKENPSDTNYAYLVKRIEELKQRLGIDASLLLRLAEYYMSAKDEEQRRKLRIDINAAFKQTIKDILVQMLTSILPEAQE